MHEKYKKCEDVNKRNKESVQMEYRVLKTEYTIFSVNQS